MILLSASPSVYVLAIGRELGIDEAVCTRVQIRDGKCLGTLDGSTCKGAFRLSLLRRCLELDKAPDESYAYGDSEHDRPVLTWARNGHLIQRGRALRLATGAAG